MQDSELVEKLRARFNSGEFFEYTFFWGHRATKRLTKSCFSQWYAAPFVIDGQTYPTAEHFMMAEKAALFGDQEAYAEILKAPNPGAAKALGRKISGFDEEHWAEHRFAIVLAANQAKFSQNEMLREFLLQTAPNILVEASPVDRIWGIGMAAEDHRARNPNYWPGLNLLGFALMQVRDNLMPRLERKKLHASVVD